MNSIFSHIFNCIFSKYFQDIYQIFSEPYILGLEREKRVYTLISTLLHNTDNTRQRMIVRSAINTWVVHAKTHVIKQLIGLL